MKTEYKYNLSLLIHGNKEQSIAMIHSESVLTLNICMITE